MQARLGALLELLGKQFAAVLINMLVIGTIQDYMVVGQVEGAELAEGRGLAVSFELGA